MNFHDHNAKLKQEMREQLAEEEKAVGEDFNIGIQTGLSNVFGIGIDSPLVNKDKLRNTMGWVFACVNVISEEIAGNEFSLKKMLPSGEIEEVEESDILNFLYKVNNVTTKFDMIKLTFQFLELTGEAPWFISFKGGKPDTAIILRPDRLTIIPGKDGELVGGYKYRIYDSGKYKEINLEPHEVIPFKYTDPDNPLRGRGPLQAAQETVDIDTYAEQFNKKFYQSGAAPAAAIETDKVLSKESRDRLKLRLKQGYEGLDNAHKTLILESGLHWKQLSLSQKDMDFLGQQTFSRDKILAIFRVPRTVLGITDDVNRANAEASDYVFAKRTIKPKLEAFVQQINEFLVPLFDESGELYIDYEDPVPENTDLNLRKADGVGKGYMTINEARELLGLDPIEGGDELREPLSFAPALNSVSGVIQNKGKKPKAKVSRSNKQILSRRNKDKNKVENFKKMILDSVVDKLTPILEVALKKKRNKKLQEKKNKVKFLWAITDEQKKQKKLEFQAVQLRIGESFEPKFKAEMNKIFDMQKIEATKKVDSGKRGNDLLDDGKNEDRYMDVLDPLIYEVIRKQSKEAFRIVGQDDELRRAKASRNRAVSAYLKRHVFSLAKQLTEHTNDLLAKHLAAGVALEESIPQLKRRIESLFEDMKGYRSERIARTEVMQATNFATEEAYIQSEVVEAKEWLAYLDDATDEDCADLDGEVRELGASFGEVDYPPLHPNCRCTVIPVVK